MPPRSNSVNNKGSMLWSILPAFLVVFLGIPKYKIYIFVILVRKAIKYKLSALFSYVEVKFKQE